MYKISINGGILSSNNTPVSIGGLGFRRIVETPSGSPQLSTPSVSTAFVSVSTMTVTWLSVNNANRYILERATSPQFDQDLVQLYSGPLTSYTDSLLFPQTTYYYRVKARDNNGVYIDSLYGTKSQATTRYHTRSVAWRYASSSDVAVYPQMTIGDAIMDGGNTDGDIYIAEGTGPTLGPGQKIWLRGGKYILIQMDFANCIGTAQNPIIVSSYGGAPVVWRQGFRVYGGSHIRITGKYDAALGIGQPHLRGHDASYAWRHRSYGFIWDNEWNSIGDSAPSGMALDHGARNFEIDYIEFREGGFTSVYFNGQNNNLDYDNIRVHDCLVYMCHGEGNYMGSTAGTVGQRAVKNLHIYNNTYIYPGNDGMQYNNLEDNCVVENNVVIGSGANWRDAFEQFQDNAASVGIRKGGFKLRKNIFWGSGEKHMNLFYVATSPNNEDGTDVQIDDNVFFGSKGQIGNFWGGSVNFPMSNTPMRLRRNYFGRYNFIYNEVYLDSRGTNTQTIIRSSINNNTITLQDNKYDNTRNSFFQNQGTGNNVTNTNNVTATLPDVQFQKFLGLGDTFDYDKVEFYKTTIGTVWDDDGSSKKGQPIVFAVNRYAVHKGFWYRSKLAGNTGIEPEVHINWRTYWAKLYWDKTTGAVAEDPVDRTNYSPYPPLDVRLVDNTNIYKETGIGLIDNPTPTTTTTSTTTTTTSAGPTTTTTTTTSTSTTTTTTSSGGVDQAYSTISVSGGVTQVWNTLEKRPYDFNSNPSATYPIIIYYVGLGEAGTDRTRLLVEGPNKYINNGTWDGRITVDSTVYDPIIISVQPRTQWPNYQLQQNSLDVLLAKYAGRINLNKVVITGFSMGGWMTSGIIMNGTTHANKLAAVVNVQGVAPADWGASPYVAMGNLTRGRWIGFEQSQDGRGIPQIANSINSANPGETPPAAQYFISNFGGGGHGSANQFYDYNLKAYGNPDGVDETWYQWAMRQSLMAP